MKRMLSKIFNNKTKKWWIVGAIVLVVCVPIVLIPITLTVNKRDFVLANYKAYMSPKVERTLHNNYGLSFDAFENAEDAKKLINQNAADIVNTTSYELVNWINEGIVKKIDWTQFNIKGINNANDALKLFIEPVQKILTGYDLNNNNKKDPDDNLLNYGVPYFVQNLVFAYRGNKINKLSLNSSWSDILNTLPNESRFNGSKPKLISLNDPRTIYSIPRLIQTGFRDINPQNDASIDQLDETYNLLANKLTQINKDPIALSDSNSVLNAISSDGNMNGAFLFNGDAIFASFGGDEANPNVNASNFHYVVPNNTLVALDMFVINNKISDTNLAKSYDILNDLCLKFDLADPKQNISFINFDYVNYTTPLKSMYNYIITSNYFSDWQVDLFKIKDSGFKYELPISNLTKSNFSFAWINFKNSV